MVGIEIPYYTLLLAGLLLACRLKSAYVAECTSRLGVFLLFCTVFALSSEWFSAVGVLRDDWLIAADSYLGVNAQAITVWVYSFSWLSTLSAICYFSMMPQIAVALLRKGNVFIGRMVFGGVLTLAAFSLMPAMGNLASSHHQELRQRVTELNNGTVEVIRLGECVGVIAAPSYHALVGVVLIATFWGTVARYPALVLNILLIVSTVPTGGHYVIDTVAGVVLGLFVCWAVQSNKE